MLPTICILAGGLGTRLGTKTQSRPKPLISVAGEPFLIHQIRLLAEHGANHIVLCVGYLGEQVETLIGERFGNVAIEYSYDSAELDGTLGAIRRARHLLGDAFLVLYGDTYLDMDYQAFAACWALSGKLGGMSVLRNANQWDQSNAIFRDNAVVTYNKLARTPDMQWIDYGLGALRQDAFGEVPKTTTDLADLYRALAQNDELFGYEVTNRFYEIGTTEGLAETELFLRERLRSD